MAASMRTLFACETANIQRLCTRIVSNLNAVVCQKKYCSSETHDSSDLDLTDDLDPEEIKRMQDVSGLSENMRQRLHSDISEISSVRDDVKNDLWFQKRMYARYGQHSGFNPSVAWPTKEELRLTKEYEAEFEPSLETMLNNIKEEKKMKMDKLEKKQAIIDKNMLKMNMWIDDYRTKSVKKKEEMVRLAEEKEKRLEEVRKQLGTRMDPKDPRVKLLLAEKEKADKKAEKIKKQQEKEAKLAAKIKIMIDSS